MRVSGGGQSVFRQRVWSSFLVGNERQRRGWPVGREPEPDMRLPSAPEVAVASREKAPGDPAGQQRCVLLPDLGPRIRSRKTGVQPHEMSSPAGCLRHQSSLPEDSVSGL